MDINSKEILENPKAILVGLNTPHRENADTFSDFEHSMIEMKSLIEACDMDVCDKLTQTLEHPEKERHTSLRILCRKPAQNTVCSREIFRPLR